MLPCLPDIGLAAALRSLSSVAVPSAASPASVAQTGCCQQLGTASVTESLNQQAATNIASNLNEQEETVP
jgi:hypothetical protein